MENYLNVKEFAKKANVSPQAIYQRIDKDLSPFVKLKDGKKTISELALKFFSENQAKKVTYSSLNNHLQEGIFLEIIEVLNKQLEEKDKQLQAAAEEKAALLERLKDAQQSQQQAHALHAGTIKQAALIELRDEQPKKRLWNAWFKGLERD